MKGLVNTACAGIEISPREASPTERCVAELDSQIHNLESITKEMGGYKILK